MKELEDGKHIAHWMSYVADRLISSQKLVKIGNINSNILVGLLGISKEDEREKYLNNLYSYLKVPSDDPINYLKERFLEIYNSTKKDDFKYRHYLSSHIPTEQDYKEYLLKIRYIALCLNGQWNEKIDPYWKLNENDSINFQISCNYTTDKLKRRLFDIITEQTDPDILYINPSLCIDDLLRRH